MRLNTISPAFGSKKCKIRIGRGMGSGFGKTCGYGHKGQKSRSGYGRKIGFEGGQLPLQRRVPKFGFVSLVNKSEHTELGLSSLNKINNSIDIISLDTLKNAKLIKKNVKTVKIICDNKGTINKPITLVGIKATKGARKVIENIGGKLD